MNSKFVLGVAFAVMVAVLGTALLQRPASVAPAAAVTQTPSTTDASGGATAVTPASTGYTMTMVAQHNSAGSCWAAINGNVYDLTNWINQHPGGQGPILSLCGTDGSAAFNGQHGGQARPASELSNFLLGPLASS